MTMDKETSQHMQFPGPSDSRGTHGRRYNSIVVAAVVLMLMGVTYLLTLSGGLFQGMLVNQSVTGQTYKLGYEDTYVGLAVDDEFTVTFSATGVVSADKVRGLAIKLEDVPEYLEVVDAHVPQSSDPEDPVVYPAQAAPLNWIGASNTSASPIFLLANGASSLPAGTTNLFVVRFRVVSPPTDTDMHIAASETYFTNALYVDFPLATEGTIHLLALVDVDDDGVDDAEDNCPSDSNPGQEDADDDGDGDECDDDDDDDGIDDADDNCPLDSNEDQTDTDDDGIGDVCDDDTSEDIDDDGVDDAEDNCSDISNPDQTDTDTDGDGDVCDDDDDGDGVDDDDDNCLLDSNPDQEDTDDDGIGDACDSALETIRFVVPLQGRDTSSTSSRSGNAASVRIHVYAAGTTDRILDTTVQTDDTGVAVWTNTGILIGGARYDMLAKTAQYMPRIVRNVVLTSERNTITFPELLAGDVSGVGVSPGRDWGQLGDCAINAADLSDLYLSWGRTYNPRMDLDGGGSVGAEDFSALRSNLGVTCEAP